jgi:hypothetical protein
LRNLGTARGSEDRQPVNRGVVRCVVRYQRHVPSQGRCCDPCIGERNRPPLLLTTPLDVGPQLGGFSVWQESCKRVQKAMHQIAATDAPVPGPPSRTRCLRVWLDRPNRATSESEWPESLSPKRADQRHKFFSALRIVFRVGLEIFQPNRRFDDVPGESHLILFSLRFDGSPWHLDPYLSQSRDLKVRCCRRRVPAGRGAVAISGGHLSNQLPRSHRRIPGQAGHYIV